MDLIIELSASDETVCRTLVCLLHEESYRVLCSHRIDVTAEVTPDMITVQTVCRIVIYRKSRVHTYSSSDSTFFCPVVRREHSLTVKVDGKMIVKKNRAYIHSDSTAVHVVSLKDTVL